MITARMITAGMITVKAAKTQLRLSEGSTWILSMTRGIKLVSFVSMRCFTIDWKWVLQRKEEKRKENNNSKAEIRVIRSPIDLTFVLFAFGVFSPFPIFGGLHCLMMHTMGFIYLCIFPLLTRSSYLVRLVGDICFGYSYSLSIITIPSL